MELQTILPAALILLVLVIREIQHERKERQLLDRLLQREGIQPLKPLIQPLQNKAASSPRLRRFARFTVNGPPRVTNITKPWKPKDKSL